MGQIDGLPDVPLLPKQHAFIADSTSANIMYSGAYGAGKTRSLCWRVVQRAQDPRARVGLGRKTMADLRRTTLSTLLEPIGDLPPVLTPGTYRYRRSAPEVIELLGGGAIIPFGFDNVGALGSTQFSDCGVDEAVEIEKEEWVQMQGRLRVTWGTRGTRPSMFCATNPDSPIHFLFQLFYKNPEAGYDRVIDTGTFDNFYLDMEYLRRLGKMRGVDRLRYLFGRWVAAEGLVYPMYDPGVHEFHHPGPFVDFIAGVDLGFANPTAIRVHGVYGDGASHVVASWYERGKTEADVVDACKAANEFFRNKDRDCITFICDPSAASTIRALQNAGLLARKANNKLEDGLRVMRDRLSPSAYNGFPRLTFEPTLDGQFEYLAYELEETKKDKSEAEKPAKKHDHVPDADRYAVMEIERMYGCGMPQIIGAPHQDPWKNKPVMPEDDPRDWTRRDDIFSI